jgi:hypothetical protein
MKLHLAALALTVAIGAGASAGVSPLSAQTAVTEQKSQATIALPTSHSEKAPASATRLTATAPTTAAAARDVAGQNDIENINKPSETAAFRATHHAQSTALMIVGGAGIVLGAILGGDSGNILMLGGGIVGLYGLYLYLQ